MLASDNHAILLELSGIANERLTITVRRNLVYESKISVARVATGFLLPMSQANFVWRSLMKMTTMTSMITYAGKTNCNQVFQYSGVLRTGTSTKTVISPLYTRP